MVIIKKTSNPSSKPLSKEMISVAGMKFFPQEVEAVLERHSAIVAACVFGVKALRLGETPIAHLMRADEAEPPSEAELKDVLNT